MPSASARTSTVYWRPSSRRGTSESTAAEWRESDRPSSEKQARSAAPLPDTSLTTMEPLKDSCREECPSAKRNPEQKLESRCDRNRIDCPPAGSCSERSSKLPPPPSGDARIRGARPDVS